MSAAQIDDPPSPSKLDLIRRFLRATGIQGRIDRGSFLEQFAIPGGPVFGSAATGGLTLGRSLEVGFAALRSTYEAHRHIWQEEYESHAHWEFTEEELTQIVAFLEGPVGQHFLEGRWRMDAYIGTNTEELIEQIVREAQESVSRQ
jgi:hypothetical protein